MTPLIVAARHDCTAVLESLLAAGADMTMGDQVSTSQFDQGCRMAASDELVLQNGATALIAAAASGHAAVAERLLQRGADVNETARVSDESTCPAV